MDLPKRHLSPIDHESDFARGKSTGLVFFTVAALAFAAAVTIGIMLMWS